MLHRNLNFEKRTFRKRDFNCRLFHQLFRIKTFNVQQPNFELKNTCDWEWECSINDCIRSPSSYSILRGIPNLRKKNILEAWLYLQALRPIFTIFNVTFDHMALGIFINHWKPLECLYYGFLYCGLTRYGKNNILDAWLSLRALLPRHRWNESTGWQPFHFTLDSPRRKRFGSWAV